MLFARALRRGLTGAAALTFALAGTRVAAAASPENRAAAHQHLNQAEELKKKGQLGEACKQLEEVERLDPQLPTLIELAECSEQVGNVAEAQAQWSAARDRAKHDEKPQSRARAEARLAAVQKRVAHLTLQLAANAPAGARVLRDDVPLEPASLAGALPMNPGDHLIVVKLAGHDDAKYAVKLAEGANQTLPIAVGPATGAQSPPPSSPAALRPSTPAPTLPLSPPAPKAVAEPPPQAQPSSWWSSSRTAGAIFGSAGIVALGAGSALLVVGNRDASKRGSIADQRVAFGGMSVACGGALFISGVVLFASTQSDEARQHARTTVSPTLLVARSATVLGAAGEF